MLFNIKNHKFKASDNRKTLLDINLPDNFYTAQNPQVILFLHGFKGYKDWGAWSLLSKKLQNNGVGFVKINFSHNGGTGKQPIDFPDLAAFSKNTYSKELADARYAIDELYRMLSDVNFELTLMGHSRGGGIAILQTAIDMRVSKLITLAAIDSIEKRFPNAEELDNWRKKGVQYFKNVRTNQNMPQVFDIYQDWLKNKEKLDIEKSAAQLQKPVCLIHGTEDATVDVSCSKNLHKLLKKSTLHLVEGANHTFGSLQPWLHPKLPIHLNTVADIILKWI